MTQLLIIYHSRTGGSRQMAEAATRAAQPECNTLLLEAAEAEPQDLLAASAYIFCAPENLASLSGQMKEFFDRCYYPVLGQLNGRAYAQMICAGSDGTGAIRQLARIAQGWRLREVHPPIVICTEAQTPKAIQAPKRIHRSELARCAELGQAMGAGLAMGMF